MTSYVRLDDGIYAIIREESWFGYTCRAVRLPDEWQDDEMSY
jgi:hypothetical protein